jgi:hypothetical protein
MQLNDGSISDLTCERLVKPARYLHIQGEGWCQLWDVEWLTGRYKKLTGYDETWISDTEIIEHAEQ